MKTEVHLTDGCTAEVTVIDDGGGVCSYCQRATGRRKKVVITTVKIEGRLYSGTNPRVGHTVKKIQEKFLHNKIVCSTFDCQQAFLAERTRNRIQRLALRTYRWS